MRAYDKAVLAVAAALTDGTVDADFSLADVNGWTEDKAHEIVVAVLKAISRIEGHGIEMDVKSEQVVDAVLSEIKEPA